MAGAGNRCPPHPIDTPGQGVRWNRADSSPTVPSTGGVLSNYSCKPSGALYAVTLHFSALITFYLLLVPYFSLFTFHSSFSSSLPPPCQTAMNPDTGLTRGEC